MFLYSRPPILRWVAALTLVAVAIWADLRPPTLVEHPFLLVDVAPGDTIDRSTVEMRLLPPGTLDPVDLPVTAERPQVAGDPVVRGAASTAPPQTVPEGWLIVELEVPAGATEGGTVVVVASGDLESEPRLIEGIVIETDLVDAFGNEVASSAFPAEDAAAVAVAVSEQRAAVLVGG